MALTELLARARADGEWTPLVDAIPFSRFLGLKVAVVDGELVTSMPFADRLIGNFTIGALHGGVVGGLLESAAIFALLHGAVEVQLPRVINVTVDYLRSGRARDAFASATITKLGRRIATVRATAWQDDRGQPIATADAHFLVTAR